MIYSMTGFGRATGMVGDRDITVEIKSLNGKQFELNNRIPPVLKVYETSLRQWLQQRLRRGSLDITIAIKQNGAARPVMINRSLATYYHDALKETARQLELDWDTAKKQLLPTLMQLPEIVTTETDSLPEEEWDAILELVATAAGQLIAHRKTEGAAIGSDLLKRITAIEELLAQIAPFEAARIQRIRERITGNVEAWVSKEKVDQNRLEQEIIFYLEKIDFSEEKQRLATHCQYFKTSVEAGGAEGIGKKLGFILQEIGREINTLGSKANDAAIQRTVVNMKDELEKAKEQVLNVL